MTMSRVDFQPSTEFFCEDERHPEVKCITFRSESSERYCVLHFQWNDQHEMLEAVATSLHLLNQEN